MRCYVTGVHDDDGRGRVIGGALKECCTKTITGNWKGMEGRESVICTILW